MKAYKSYRRLPQSLEIALIKFKIARVLDDDANWVKKERKGVRTIS